MASPSQHLAVPSPRLRALVVPREHGAWGMLIVPLVTGAVVGSIHGRHFLNLILLLALSLLLFCLRTPVESLLGTQPIKAQTPDERYAVMTFTAAMSVVGCIFLTALLWNGQNLRLVWIGAAAAACFVLQALLRKLGRSTRMASQIIGSFGLCASAAAAYYSVTGSLDQTALTLWFLNWLFAANQVHFVQTVIHGAKTHGLQNRLKFARFFVLGNFGLLVALAAGCQLHLLPALTLFAFAASVCRGLHWLIEQPAPLNVRALGWSEMRQAAIFGVLIIFSFTIHF